MIKLTIQELAAALSAKIVLPRTQIDSFGTTEPIEAAEAGDNFQGTISGELRIDSRKVLPGDLFLALEGENHDGHDFISTAVEAGAAAVIVSKLEEHLTVPQIVVDDSKEALAQLASYVLSKVKALGKLKVIAITGSNGKTTTKNLLGAILKPRAKTVAQAGSLNNETGVPLSVLEIAEDTEFLVIELGADAPGDIKKLVPIVKPDLVIVLKVGLAHLGGFGTIEQTQKTKAELITELPSEAIAILNYDDPLVREMKNWTKAQLRFFTVSPEAAPKLGRRTQIEAEFEGEKSDKIQVLEASDLQLTLAGTSFKLSQTETESNSVQLKILGEHQVYNTLAAVAAASALGVPIAESIAAVQEVVRAEQWRMETLPLENGAILINDAYNASPDSTAAALKTLAQLAENSGRRSVAILGHMAELGEASLAEHSRIGILAVRLNIKKLFVVGELAKQLFHSAVAEGSWDNETVFVPDLESAYSLIAPQLTANDLILVKSSKSANLRFLGDNLAGVNR